MPTAEELLKQAKALNNAQRYQEAIDLLDHSSEKYTNPDFYVEIARSYLLLNKEMNAPQAIEYYNKAIAIAPQDPYAHKELGTVYLDLKQYEKAIESYLKAADITPNDAFLFNSLGYLHRTIQQQTKAVDYYQKAIDINANDPYPYQGLGNVCYDLKQYDKAIEFYDKAALLNPKDHFIFKNLGSLYRDLKQHDKAIEYYSKAIELTPRDAAIFNSLGNIYRTLKQYDKAIEYFNIAIELEPKDYIYNDMGSAYRDIRQYDKAIESYIKATELNAGSSYAFNGLGNIYYDLGQNSKAIEYYQKAIEADPRNVMPYHGLGNTYYNLGQYDKAIEFYKAATRIDSNYAPAYNGLGFIYETLQQHPQAIENYHKAAAIDPKDSYSYNGLGNVYSTLQDYDKAIEAYQKAIENDPDNPDPYNGLGIAYKDRGDNEKAIMYYTEAINKNPKYEYAYYNRALIYYNTEQYAKSLADFRMYQTLTGDAPNNYIELVKLRIEELKRLVGDEGYSAISELVTKIKKLLLFTNDCVTHYTSLSVTQLLVLENSLFRLSEGAYLNDTSEGGQLFDYLSFHTATSKGDTTVEKKFSPKPFIGSFVAENKHNDLTLWRMYGKEAKEEARGCALTIRRSQFLDNLKNKSKSEGKSGPSVQTDEEYSFYKVAYRKQENNHFSIPDATEEEEVLLNDYMKDLQNKTKFYSTSQRKPEEIQSVQELLNGIAYLFKSAEYQYEHEVRLVVEGPRFDKMIDTKFTPTRVYIQLIPLSPVISTITLGPKVDRADEWASAFYYSLVKQGLKPEIYISHLPFK